MTGALPADAKALEGSCASPILGTAIVSLNGGRLQVVLELHEVRLLLDAGRDDPEASSPRVSRRRQLCAHRRDHGRQSGGDDPFRAHPVGRVRTGFRFLDPTLPHSFTRQEAE